MDRPRVLPVNRNKVLRRSRRLVDRRNVLLLLPPLLLLLRLPPLLIRPPFLHLRPILRSEFVVLLPFALRTSPSLLHKRPNPLLLLLHLLDLNPLRSSLFRLVQLFLSFPSLLVLLLLLARNGLILLPIGILPSRALSSHPPFLPFPLQLRRCYSIPTILVEQVGRSPVLRQAISTWS
jgi:hypothetical protein